MNWLLNRLKERSTWLAIFTMAGLVGIKIEPELREVIINAILAVAAVIAFVFRENVRERSTDQDQSARTPPLPPIELTGKSESTDEFPNIPPMAFDDSPHPRRRVSDQLRDTLPSIPRFKNPASPHSGSVGWNDDH
jgi:hypothetical protein